MKKAGWIFLSIGGLSLLGALLAGHSLIGGAFCAALGVTLIVSAEAKEKDNEINKKDDGDSN